MEFVPRFMGGEEMKAVGENLPALDQPCRANHDGFRTTAIEDSA